MGSIPAESAQSSEPLHFAQRCVGFLQRARYMKRYACPYCGREQRNRSARSYRENPLCRLCLHERVERVAGVAEHVENEVIEKIRELQYLLEYATEADRAKRQELEGWFMAYKARATAAAWLEVQRAVRRHLWPKVIVAMMAEAESEDPEVAAGARLTLEEMRAFQEGDDN